MKWTRLYSDIKQQQQSCRRKIIIILLLLVKIQMFISNNLYHYSFPHGKIQTSLIAQHVKPLLYRPYAYDVIISWRPPPPPPLGLIGLRVNALLRSVPLADHKRVQSFDSQHGAGMTTMHLKIDGDETHYKKIIVKSNKQEGN